MENSIQKISNVDLKIMSGQSYRERLKEIQKQQCLIYHSRGAEIEYERLNTIFIKFSIELLLSHGDPVQAKSSKIPNKKFHQNCNIRNAKRICFDHGYGYVEGIATNKKTNFTLAHAWNIDIYGNHVDMTIKDAENYIYLGIQIPIDIVKFMDRIKDETDKFILPFLELNPN